jgi:hypothetical protein
MPTVMTGIAITMAGLIFWFLNLYMKCGGKLRWFFGYSMVIVQGIGIGVILVAIGAI